VRSAEFAKRGWVSLRLKPGIYHLQVRDARFHRTFVGLPRYRLYVSPRRSLSYAGTFLSISAYDSRYVSEAEEARKLTGVEFKAGGPVAVVLAHPADQYASTRPIGELGPIAIQAAATRTLVQPDWAGRTARERMKNTALTEGREL